MVDMSGCCGINKSKYKSIQINKLNLNVIAIGFVLWDFDQSYIFFKFPVFPNISTILYSYCTHAGFLGEADQVLMCDCFKGRSLRYHPTSVTSSNVGQVRC